MTIFDFIEKNKHVKDKKLPDGITLKRNEYWCPYCSTKAIFVKNKKLGVRQCPFCGISENDYFVKKVNRRL